MLLNNALGGGRSDVVVPDALRIDDGDGALLAHTQAVGFGAKHTRAGRHQAELGEALLEVVPRGEAFSLRAALRLGLVSAEEDMALDLMKAETVGLSGEAGGVDGIHYPPLEQIGGRVNMAEDDDASGF
jgi:hypothetical protein